MADQRGEICADCGQAVTPGPRHVYGSWRDNRGTLVCRSTMLDGCLISADYHYVDGETQRHFPHLIA